MVWSEVGTAYRALFDRVARSSLLSGTDLASGRLPRGLLRAVQSGVLDA